MGAATSEVVEPRAARPRKRLSTLVQRLGLVPDPPGDNVYHGFISYSHAADEELARALQRGFSDSQSRGTGRARYTFFGMRLRCRRTPTFGSR